LNGTCHVEFVRRRWIDVADRVRQQRGIEIAQLLDKRLQRHSRSLPELVGVERSVFEPEDGSDGLAGEAANIVMPAPAHIESHAIAAHRHTIGARISGYRFADSVLKLCPQLSAARLEVHR